MTPDLHAAADPSDEALVTRWREGDQRAATALVARHAPAIAGYIASLGCRTGGEDLVQDTFVRAFGALEGFRGESALRTWLFSIARRLVLDRRRAARRQPEAVPIEDADLVAAGDPLEGLVAREAHARMRGALARLTATQREVFLLRVNEGLSYREIAGLASTTEGAARVHYHNALRVVKESLHA